MTLSKIIVATTVAILATTGIASAKAHISPGDPAGAAADSAPGKAKGLTVAGTVSKGGASNNAGVNTAIKVERSLDDSFKGYGQLVE